MNMNTNDGSASETPSETLARWRKRAADRRRAQRSKAGAILGGLTLDQETLAALNRVQHGLSSPNRSAAIRAAIHLAAEAVELQNRSAADAKARPADLTTPAMDYYNGLQGEPRRSA